MDKIVLPNNHVMEYNGIIYNWFVGDSIATFENQGPIACKTFWAFGVPQRNGFNTLHAVYCGKFYQPTRELTEIKVIPHRY